MIQKEHRSYPDEEIWKDIPGYEGFYQASTHGRLRSVDRLVYNQFKPYLKKGIILKQKLNDQNRLKINLSKQAVYRTYQVHRLIGLVFVPNPDNKPQIDHIDTDPTNNHYTNLRWVTDAEHKKISVAQGITCRGQYHGNAKLSTIEVAEMRKLYSEGVSQNKLAEMYNSHQQTVSLIVQYKSRIYE